MSVGLQLCFAGFLLLFLAADGGVSFSNKNFTMTCPQIGEWYDGNNLIGKEGLTLTLEYNDRRPYYCKYESTKYYYFYVQGKVCENCFELDGEIWAAIIVVDMVLTGVVMAIVYNCTKRRSSAGFLQTQKAGSHPGGRAPPVPSPDYERLNPHTLSQGTYSEVRTNRMD